MLLDQLTNIINNEKNVIKCINDILTLNINYPRLKIN